MTTSDTFIWQNTKLNLVDKKIWFLMYLFKFNQDKNWFVIFEPQFYMKTKNNKNEILNAKYTKKE